MTRITPIRSPKPLTVREVIAWHVDTQGPAESLARVRKLIENELAWSRQCWAWRSGRLLRVSNRAVRLLRHYESMIGGGN